MPSSLAKFVLVLLISHGEGFRHCHGEATSSWLAQGLYFVLFGGYGESIRVNLGLDHQQCSIGPRMECPSVAVSSCHGLQQHGPDDKCENYYERKLEYFAWAYPCKSTEQNFSASKAMPKKASIFSSVFGCLYPEPTRSTPRPDTWCVTAGAPCVLPPEESKFTVSPIAHEPTFDALQQVFERSVYKKKTADRVGDVPDGYEVTDIYSIKNSGSMQSRYDNYLKRVENDLMGFKIWPFSNVSIQAEWVYGDGEWLGYMKSGTKPIRQAAPWTSKILQSAALPDDQLEAAGLILNLKVNEVLLIHGTDVQNLPQIVTTGLQVSFGKDKKLFGKGLYFAESSSKIDEYSRPHAEYEVERLHSCCGMERTSRTVERSDIHYAFMAKVVLGNAYPDRAEDPVCKHMNTSDARNEIAKFRCHSVIGYRKFREFVVYHDEAVQLGWVIKYRKIWK